MNNMVITMYADNDTIVNGGKVCNMKEIRGTEVYRYFQDNDWIRDYISSMMTAGHLRWSRRDGCFFSRSWTFMRKIIWKRCCWSTSITVNRTLEKWIMTRMYLSAREIRLSYQMAYSSIGKEFQTFDQTGRVGYCQELEFYGMDLDIMSCSPNASRGRKSEKPAADWFLIVVNAILPPLLVRI